MSQRRTKKSWKIVTARRGYCDGYYRKQNGKEMLSLKRPRKETEPKKEKMDYILQEKN